MRNVSHRELTGNVLVLRMKKGCLYIMSSKANHFPLLSGAVLFPSLWHRLAIRLGPVSALL